MQVVDTSSRHACRFLMQAAGIREQHPLEVCLLCSHSQLAEGTVQHTPDVLGKVCVWCDMAPPQVIQKLHHSTTGNNRKRERLRLSTSIQCEAKYCPGLPRSTTSVYARGLTQEPCSRHKATKFMTGDGLLRRCCPSGLARTAVKLLVWLEVESSAAYLLYNAA